MTVPGVSLRNDIRASGFYTIQQLVAVPVGIMLRRTSNDPKREFALRWRSHEYSTWYTQQ